MGSSVDDEQSQGVPVSPPWGTFGRDVTLGVVSLGSKFLLQWLNTYTTTNVSVLQDAVNERPVGQGLLTVCNHTRYMRLPLTSLTCHTICVLACISFNSVCMHAAP